MDRVTIVAFTVLVGVTTVLAAGAVLWFGVDGQLANVPSIREIEPSPRSVWLLFAVPGLLAIQGAICAAVLPRPRFGNLSEDAQRGLNRQRSAVRCFFIGVGVLVAGLQVVAILRTSGVPLPLEADLRAFYFGYGVLLAYAGNFAPKTPVVPDEWLGTAGQSKASRFLGWVFTVGGILMCFAALIVPVEQIQATTFKLILAMIGLPVLNALLLFFAYRRESAG